jgi:hypothetical protein
VIKLHRVLLAGALLALVSAPAHAADIIGGLSLAGVQVSQDSTDLLLSNVISSAETQATSSGSGDLAGVPVLPAQGGPTFFGANTITLTDAASGFGFAFSNTTYGSFTGESGMIVQRSANFLDLYILGTLTKGSVSGLASARISINLSGADLSEAITVHAPPLTIPEPTSVVMAGISLAAAGFVGLRKRAV